MRFTVAELAKEVEPIVRRLTGAARRYGVEFTEKVKWTLAGHTRVKEKIYAEVFGNVGFISRPPTSGTQPEVITLNIAGADHPVIVASRDEKVMKMVRDAISGGFPANAAAMANTLAMVYVTPAGTVEIRTLGGVAYALALKSDVDALAAWDAVHTHAVAGVTVGSGGVTSAVPTTAGTIPTAVGTSTLLGG